MRRRVGGFVAGLLVVLTLQPGPASAAESPGSPSVAPMAASDPPLPSGLTAVTGGTKGSLAAPVTTGRYLDHTVKAGTFTFYSITRTIPGSTIDFGATLLRDRGYVHANHLSAVLAYPDSSTSSGITRCGHAEHEKDQRADLMPLVTAGGYSLAKRGECATKKTLLLAVYDPPTSKIPAGVPYELDVWETPPVGNLDKLPPAGFGSSDQVTVTEPVTRTTPGPWMAQAPTLRAGETTYADLPLGRVSWFAVEVPFNYELDAVATLADPTGADVGAGVEMVLVSPVGQVVGVPQLPGDRFKQTATLGSAPVTVESKGYLVSPQTRVDTDNVNGLEGQETMWANPGVYYIAMYAADDTGDPSATVQVTLTPGLLRGTGAYAHGADPAYAAAIPTFPLPRGVEPVAYVSAADHAGSGPGLLLPGILLGLAVVLLLVGVVALRSRRPR